MAFFLTVSRRRRKRVTRVTRRGHTAEGGRGHRMIDEITEQQTNLDTTTENDNQALV